MRRKKACSLKCSKFGSTSFSLFQRFFTVCEKKNKQILGEENLRLVNTRRHRNTRMYCASVSLLIVTSNASCSLSSESVVSAFNGEEFWRDEFDFDDAKTFNSLKRFTENCAIKTFFCVLFTQLFSHPENSIVMCNS
jgi:hypothetical protein